ncbi:hypothetical protein [uncultured Bradyrhizobium sp.]|uniref:hypothetical protein n=1 Tax=uncultured Bradyrhizobium sp. TaxID=199684 RepID=UPI0035CA0B50
METYHLAIKSQFGIAFTTVEAESPDDAIARARKIEELEFSLYTLQHDICAVEVFADDPDRTELKEWRITPHPGYPEQWQTYWLMVEMWQHMKRGSVFEALRCLRGAISLVS